jgi:Flp pilus assembly protein TadD
MLGSLFRDVLAQRSKARRAKLGGTTLDAAAWQKRRNELGRDDQTGRRALIDELDAALQTALVKLTRDGQAFPVELLAGWRLLGDWRWQDGNYDAAETAYRQALRCNPLDAKSQEGLGLTLLHLRRLDEAWLHFEVAHRVEPMDSDVLTHWGLVDVEFGNLNSATERFRKAIERNPRNPHAWHNLGLVALRLGDRERCVSHLRKSVELKPDHGLGWSNLALALRMVEDLPGAMDAARRATELKGHNNARVWTVLGDVECDAGDFDSALQHAHRALELDPKQNGAQVLLGKAWTSTGDFAKAETAYRAVIERAPDHAEARGGLAQLLLLQARWAEGWPLYEARRHATYRAVRDLPIPAWNGKEDLAGKSLIVHSEQGLGDVIVFSSCLNDVVATGARVTFEVPPRLASLMQRSFPAVEVLSHDFGDTSLAWLGAPSAYERELAAGSMPMHFRRTAESFGSGEAFLRADPQAVARWRAQLLAPGRPGFVLGISWRGGLVHTGGEQRSIALLDLVDTLAPVLNGQNAAAGQSNEGVDTAGLAVSLLSLQHGEVDAEIDAAQAATGRLIHRGPSNRADLDDIAAATCACDAVLTVCSTQAHLTGALGQTGLVLVPSNPNWRYGATGSRTPWYSSLTLVRQQAMGDWAAPLAQAGDWLALQLAARVGSVALANPQTSVASERGAGPSPASVRD